MRIAFIADTHFKFNDRYGLYALKKELFGRILEKTTSESDLVVIAGDSVDHRYFDTVVATELSEIFNNLGDNLRKVYYLSGNHDSSMRAFTQLSPFAVASGLKIVTAEPVTVSDITLQGWCNNDVPQSETSFYCGHLSIKDWIGKGISIEDLKAKGYKTVFTGDFHKPVDTKGLISIGTLFPSSFSDKGIRGGWVEFDTDTLEFQRFVLPTEKYPMFRSYKADDAFVVPPKDEIENNIVKVDIHLTFEKKQVENRIKEEFLSKNPRKLITKSFGVAPKILSTEAQTETPLDIINADINANPQQWTTFKTDFTKEILTKI